MLSREIGKKIDGQVEHFSDMSGNVQEAASEKMDDVGAGANAFIDRMKDRCWQNMRKDRIARRREGSKIASPEARTSILGLDDAEKSMAASLSWVVLFLTA